MGMCDIATDKNQNKNITNEGLNPNSSTLPSITPLPSYKTNGINKNILLNIASPNFKFVSANSIQGHDDTIVCLIELTNGNIVTGSYDQNIKIWDVDTFKLVKQIKTSGKIFCLLEFSSGFLLCGTENNTIELYDINNPTQELKLEYKGHLLWVNCLAKCNEEYFASGSNDSDIRIWKFVNAEQYNVLSDHSKGVLSLITLKNGKLCSGSADLSIKIWNWQTKICEANLLGHLRWVKCLFELEDGTIISGSDDKTIRIWKNNICVDQLIEHQKSVRALCQLSNNLIVSGSFDKTIKIWDINSKKCVQTLFGHTSNVICLLLHSKQLLISTSNDKTIKFWKLE